MLTYVYYEDVFLEKQKFNQEQDENYSLQFVKILLVFFSLFLAWNIYSHCNQIDLINNGTSVLGTVSESRNDKYITYTAKDGKLYQNRIFTLFSPKPGDTIPVYYMDDPAEAAPMISPYFFYATYMVSIIVIVFCLRKIIRTRRIIRKNRTSMQDTV